MRLLIFATPLPRSPLLASRKDLRAMHKSDRRGGDQEGGREQVMKVDAFASTLPSAGVTPSRHCFQEIALACRALGAKIREYLDWIGQRL